MRIRFTLAAVAIGTAAGISIARLRRWWKTWGVEPAELAVALPGDDIVADPVAVETRGITIDAPPSAVWPWLLQMGYGRGGWYSYDQLDQRGQSVQEIVDAWQALAVGDIVPTHPGGGFEVTRLDPGRALVLRSDTELVRSQAAAAKAARAVTGETERPTPGIQASGAILSSTPEEFSATWAFVLEPAAGGRTRLIERFRVWYGEAENGSRLVMPLLGFGVFVMMQKQMTGLQARAEALASGGVAEPVEPSVPAEPVPVGA